MSALRRYHGKVSLTIAFGAIAVAAGAITSIPAPAGPWEGLYRTYWPAWLAISIGIFALISAGKNAYRKPYRLMFIGAVGLLAIVVTLPTLEWGVPYGIRDPWVHLHYTKVRSFFETNPYPMLHACLAVASRVMDIDIINLIARVQVVAPFVGVIWLAATVRTVTKRRYWGAALLATFPVVFVETISRPFTIGLLFVLLYWWLLTTSPATGRYRLLLIGGIPVVLWWHPVGAIIIGLLFGTVWVTRRLTAISAIESMGISRASKIGMLIPIIAIGAIFVYHALFLSTFGSGLLISIFAATTEQTTGSGGEPIVTNILAKIFEFFLRASFIILLSGIGLFAALTGWRKGGIPEIVISSGISSVILVGVFVMIDLMTGVGFGAQRVVVLAPLTLVPGAAVGLQRTSTPIFRVFVVLLIVTAGLGTVYSSPLIGGTEVSVTTGDVEGVDWLRAYRGEAPVVGSESTYYILEGRYGGDAVQAWSNGQPFRYYSGKRTQGPAWNVSEQIEGTYYAVSYPARLNARQSQSIGGYQEFALKNSRIYDNGNLWWYKKNNT